MARTTRGLARTFSGQAAEARDLISAAESSSRFGHTRRLYVYEAAYLLGFSAWENLLEQAMLRFLCGHQNAGGRYARQGNLPHFRAISNANAHVLRGRSYLLWHNPAEVIVRANRELVGAPHALIIGSALADLNAYAAIRHHVAHRNQDTRAKFDAATLLLTGRRFRASRAGRMLRSSTLLPATGAMCTWCERILHELESLSGQIAG